jgi:hypothetical protein
MADWQAAPSMTLEFSGEIVHWRGPTPWYFVAMPEEQGSDLKQIASAVTYGWGVIPVRAQIGATRWETSLVPKDGQYMVPIRASVRKAEKLEQGDTVHIVLHIG